LLRTKTPQRFYTGLDSLNSTQAQRGIISQSAKQHDRRTDGRTDGRHGDTTLTAPPTGVHIN